MKHVYPAYRPCGAGNHEKSAEDGGVRQYQARNATITFGDRIDNNDAGPVKIF